MLLLKLRSNKENESAKNFVESSNQETNIDRIQDQEDFYQKKHISERNSDTNKNIRNVVDNSDNRDEFLIQKQMTNPYLLKMQKLKEQQKQQLDLQLQNLNLNFKNETNQNQKNNLNLRKGSDV